MIRPVRNTVVLVSTLAAFALIVGLTRTFRLRSPQVSAGQPAPISIVVSAAASRLAALVRLPTVSWDDASKRNVEAFDGIQQLLAESFPRVHHALTRESVASWSLLYTWRGTRE